MLVTIRWIDHRENTFAIDSIQAGRFKTSMQDFKFGILEHTCNGRAETHYINRDHVAWFAFKAEEDAR